MSNHAEPRDGEPPREHGYPVLDSAELSPVTRRWFRRARRELHEIPRQPPGTVLVFQHGDAYETLAEPDLRLDAPLVVDAVAVAVVSTRHTLREAVAYLPSADTRTCVSLRARFHCWVTDPQLVLDAGCWDLDSFLVDHLVADRRLRFIAQSTDPHTGWPLFHRNATARIFAYHDLHPLIVPGLRTRLVDVAVEPQRLATPPRPRDDSRPMEVPPVVENHGPDASDERDGHPTGDAGPTADGNPAFMPDNYTWGGNP
ncbi:hypothetical protein AB0877_17260 [Micromonospora sp. NPDC047644]|uniref:hypothetical protein n=1 Tax=Micromonospora sp. NPDC047644 TaxID=3157203 RepID=UPI00345555C2